MTAIAGGYRDNPFSQPAFDPLLEQHFERHAHLDRWVHRHSQDLRTAYEEHAGAFDMLALASGAWMGADRALCERAVAALAAAVAGSVSIHLEPACARLVWAAERERGRDDALQGAKDHALLSLAKATKNSDREAAECVWHATRFLSEPFPSARTDALVRLIELASRRIINVSAVIGAHLPFWRFPYAHRWSRPLPALARGPKGLPAPAPVEDGLGYFVLAYRSGHERVELAEAVLACASAARHHPNRDALSHSRSTALIAEFGEALKERWSIWGAKSPADLVERVVPETLARPWLAQGLSSAQREAGRVMNPLLARRWPSLVRIAGAHSVLSLEQRTLLAVA